MANITMSTNSTTVANGTTNLLNGSLITSTSGFSNFSSSTTTVPFNNFTNFTSTVAPPTAIFDTSSLRMALWVTSMSLNIIVTLFMNIFIIVVYARVKQIRSPLNNFLINLAAVDIMAALVWCLPSLIAGALGSWPLGGALCQMQGYFISLFCLLNMHTFSVIAVERWLKICRPSKHDQVFSNTTVTIILVALWVFDLISAVFPLVGWSEVIFLPMQYHCTINHASSISQLVFLSVLTIIFPLCVIPVCYIRIFLKVSRMRRTVAPGATLVLEEHKNIPKESYAEKLHKTQLKFKNAGMKKSTKPVREILVDDKEKAADVVSSSSDSSDEEDGQKNTSLKTETEKKKRTYKFKPHELAKTKTMLISNCDYFCIWLCYFAVMGYWVASDPRAAPPEVVFTVAAWLTHCGTWLKPVVYIAHNARFRAAAKKALLRKTDDEVEGNVDVVGPKVWEFNQDYQKDTPMTSTILNPYG